ncbi:hypothetical protein M440DRAFT_1156179 [Trichoderma longibrachiatum ATCC 18648]|uniref:AT hook domain-containing protein n=1 Tax=Trichoderma longibrachiatum ATCC 18648 TaxID=983965 RepID=A0A2T4CBI8_TRILO|nr:hypothetical protein M440DRAFT_1156179 [Trichoderma longibrachiatum ATCC 18648]
MSRGDESFPRYTYMMDFNPDEDTPLRDYWQTADPDDLDNEDAATIASLATQALQSKNYGYGYGYGSGDGQVSESLVANYLYSESRSSPQSQHSTAMQAEPAESFRGLMEDHDRGARLAEENAMTDYDFHHEARGHVSEEVAGMEDPTSLSREQQGHEEERFAHDAFRPLVSAAAADENLSHTYQVEMSAAMTASRVVNGVLRRSYASTPNEMDLDPQPLQSQAPQPTSPQSESSPVSVETPEVVEPEQEVTIADDEHQVDGEPEAAPVMEHEKGNEEGDEDMPDHGNEVPREDIEEVREDGEPEEEVRVEELDQAEDMRRTEVETSEEAGVEEEDAQRTADQGEATEEAQAEETRHAQREEEAWSEAGVQQQIIMESNERPTIDDSDNLPPPRPAPRKRGRPRKSDAALVLPDSVPEQLQAAEVSVHEESSFVREAVETAATDDADISRAAEVPTGRKRGRPRKSELSDSAPTARPRSASAKRGPGRPPKAIIDTPHEPTQAPTVSTGKRGRPRKSSMADGAQATSVQVLTAAPPASGKRGRPRKSETRETSVQASITETGAPTTGETGAGVSVPGRRGRPRKSETILTDEAQLSTVDPAASEARGSSRRGRPRKSETTDNANVSTNEARPSTTEAPAVESALPTTHSKKRGRPRKSEAMPINEVQVPLVESTTSAARSSIKRGRPRKRDVSAHESQLPELERSAAGIATPAARSSSRRGRPRKSDTSGVTRDSAVKPQPPFETAAVGAATPMARSSSRRGRPRKSDLVATAHSYTDESQLSADELTVQATTPAARSLSRRGRPRKRDTLDIIEAPIDKVQPSADETRSEAITSVVRSLSRRGRPRKRDTLDGTQISTGEEQLLEAEITPEAMTPAARSSSRRGRPRKSDLTRENTQVLANESQIPTVQRAASRARSSSRRGRPRKSDVTSENTQAFANESQLPPFERAASRARSSSRRGRPRKSSFVGAETQAITAGPRLSAVGAPDTATPASNKRGRRRRASVASSTATPGVRGRPPKNTVPLSPAEIEETLTSDNPTTTAVSTFSIPLGQPIRAFLDADEAEETAEEAAPPSPLSVTKRGRGRPPKNPALLPANTSNSAPAEDPAVDIWEFQSPISKNVPRGLTALMKASRSTEEATEGTPVRKRGRRKSVVLDQPLPAMDVSVASPAKKRGRPPKKTAVVPLAEVDGPSVEVDGPQEDEGPVAKRIRTDDDTAMEDAVYEDEPQVLPPEDAGPSVSEQTETTEPSLTTHQQSPLHSPRSSESPEASSAVSDPSASYSRPDEHPRVTEDSPTTTERLDKGTQTKAVEKPPSEPPRSIFELLAGARRTNKVQKTYGKRFKRL